MNELINAFIKLIAINDHMVGGFGRASPRRTPPHITTYLVLVMTLSGWGPWRTPPMTNQIFGSGFKPCGPEFAKGLSQVINVEGRRIGCDTQTNCFLSGPVFAMGPPQVIEAWCVIGLEPKLGVRECNSNKC